MKILQAIYYAAPVAPFICRSILLYYFWSEMRDILSSEEQDRLSHRAHLQTMAGFSFSALLALILIDVILVKGFQLPIYYLFVSFMCYLFASNIQSYKAKRWHDQITTAIGEAAALALILSIISMIYLKELNRAFAIAVTIIGLAVWLIDHCLRIRFAWEYLEEKGGSTNDKERE